MDVNRDPIMYMNPVEECDKTIDEQWNKIEGLRVKLGDMEEKIEDLQKEKYMNKKEFEKCVTNIKLEPVWH